MESRAATVQVLLTTWTAYHIWIVQAGGAAAGKGHPAGGSCPGAERVAPDDHLAGEGEVQPVSGAGVQAGTVLWAAD